MDICDFASSYVFWKGMDKVNSKDDRKPGHMGWTNSARIQIDGRCRISNGQTGESEWYYLITACRTEWMYRSDELWQVPNHEYCGFFSDSEFMAGHVKAGDVSEYGGDIRVSKPIEGNYAGCDIHVTHFPHVQELANDEQAVQATFDYLPIIARTEVWDDGTGSRAVIEYPIKTMNVQPERKRMQVDTGPLPFPDLAASVERDIERLSMAFVCYNTYDVAEFVLRKPTPVMRDGEEVGSVIDYSEVRRVPAKTTLYTAGAM